ncbi:MAG: hypothetical protein QG639_961 [Patescibacteria group bacterium]|jgi:hypothetical protein|nr:hypothetical protein [Patescibacteria group bacterium]
MADQASANVENLFNKDALGEVNKSTVQSGEWMTIQQASNATGWSMGTLRRYVKARRIKSRRQGRSINSKLEILITADMLPDGTGDNDVMDFDGEIDSTVEGTEEDDFQTFPSRDQADQSLDSTLNWMRQKLDEKDALLREKEAKIEALAQQLTGASYRNGFLEAEKSKFEEKLLLLEDRLLPEQSPAPLPEIPQPKSTWAKLAGWLTGQS